MRPQTSFYPGAIYYLYNHANGFENLFYKEESYFYFLNRYRFYVGSIAETFAYCLMPNHFHFLIRIRTMEELTAFLQAKKEISSTDLQGLKDLGGLDTLVAKLPSQQLSNFFNCYTKSINKAIGRRGSLFRPNMKRKLIENDEYLTRLVRYIHLNPFLHGFVEDPKKWAFSSLNAYMKESPSRINRETVFDWFGGERLFREHHKAIIEAEVERVEHFIWGEESVIDLY